MIESGIYNVEGYRVTLVRNGSNLEATCDYFPGFRFIAPADSTTRAFFPKLKVKLIHQLRKDLRTTFAALRREEVIIRFPTWRAREPRQLPRIKIH